MAPNCVESRAAIAHHTVHRNIGQQSSTTNMVRSERAKSPHSDWRSGYEDFTAHAHPEIQHPADVRRPILTTQTQAENLRVTERLNHRPGNNQRQVEPPDWGEK